MSEQIGFLILVGAVLIAPILLWVFIGYAGVRLEVLPSSDTWMIWTYFIGASLAGLSLGGALSQMLE